MIISLFSTVQIWGLRAKDLFAVFGGYFAPWTRIRGSAHFCNCETQDHGFFGISKFLKLIFVLRRIFLIRPAKNLTLGHSGYPNKIDFFSLVVLTLLGCKQTNKQTNTITNKQTNKLTNTLSTATPLQSLAILSCIFSFSYSLLES